MLVHTMHEVRENEGDLNVTVMCSVPSEDPFTLLVRSTDGTAIGKQIMVQFSQETGVLLIVHAFCMFVLYAACTKHQCMTPVQIEALCFFYIG